MEFYNIGILSLASLTQYTLRFICSDYPGSCMCQQFISFYCQIVFHCMTVPHFIYPFIPWWTFGFSPLSHCHQQLCYTHSCSSICVNICFISLGYKWNLYFNFSRNCQTVFQNSCTILYFFHILPSTGLCLFVFCLFPLFFLFFSAFPLITFIHFFKNSILIYFMNEHLSTHTQNSIWGYISLCIFFQWLLYVSYMYNLSSTFLSVPVN